MDPPDNNEMTVENPETYLKNNEEEEESPTNMDEDEDDELPEILPSVEKVFQIPLVLEHIFGYLKTPHLKSCRLVDFTWYSASTQLLHRQASTITILRYCPTFYDPDGLPLMNDLPQSFIRCSRLRRTQRHAIRSKYSQTLRELDELLQKCPLFPSTHFVFMGLFLEDPDFQKFLQNHGSKILTLEFQRESYEPPSSKSTFHRILTQLVPNMESLILENLPYVWKKTDVPEKPLVLPTLQHFSWNIKNTDRLLRPMTSYLDSMVPEFLSPVTCPNLKSLKNPESTDEIASIDKASRGNLVTGVDLYGKMKEMRNIQSRPFTELKRLTVQIEEPSTVPFYPFELAGIKHFIQPTLIASKDTLEYLKLPESAPYFQYHIQDQFPNCKTLVLLAKFPEPHISLDYTFPILKILDCTLLVPNPGTNVENWEDTFPPAHPLHSGRFTSVEILKVADTVSAGWIRHMKTVLCPNVKEIVVEGGIVNCKVPECLLKMCENWPEIPRMELRMNSPTYKCLDEVFTGLSERLCRGLKMTGTLEGPGFFVPDQRNKLTIQDLTELKYLKISLGTKAQDREDCKRIPFTLFSYEYAFQHMPKLTVCLDYDHGSRWALTIKEDLWTLAPFVLFDHSYDFRVEHCMNRFKPKQ